MKVSTTTVVCLGGPLSALALANPQSDPIPSDVSVPVFAAPTGMTVIPITFTADFGTVPAGYVTYLTQPIQPLGPVYSAGTASVTVSELTTTKATSSKVSLATPIPASAHHSSSSGSLSTTSPTTTQTATGVSQGQQTSTGAANAMAAGVGLPAGVAAVLGFALL